LENRVQELQNQLRDSTLSQANAAVGSHPSFGEITLAVQALRPPPLSAAAAFAYIPQALNSWFPGDEMPEQLRLNLSVFWCHLIGIRANSSTAFTSSIRINHNSILTYSFRASKSVSYCLLMIPEAYTPPCPMLYT